MSVTLFAVELLWGTVMVWGDVGERANGCPASLGNTHTPTCTPINHRTHQHIHPSNPPPLALVSSRAHAGAPVPWNSPLMIHSDTNHGRLLPRPNTALATAVAKRPNESIW